MPKPTQTMLDQLASMMKASGRKKPAIIQETAYQDPLSGSIVGRKVTSLTPERQTYQQRLESLRRQKMEPIREEEIDARKRFKELQDDFEDAYSEAYYSWRNDVDMAVPEVAPNLEYGFEPSDLDFPATSGDLRDYWPSDSKYYDVFEREADDLRDELAGIEDRMDYARSPEYIQQLQTETPRYRNYQRAMQQRQENARVGRLNAAIMNLYRQGYSMPEIREILRSQGVR